MDCLAAENDGLNQLVKVRLVCEWIENDLAFNTQEAVVDWNRVEGNWKQVKGKVKEQWGKLTDDDLDTIDGKREQLEGKIQERYGYAKDQARKDIDDWYNSQRWQ